MLPRERVEACLAFRRPDIVPVEYHDSPAGLYEHGAALTDIWRRYEQDFNCFRELPIPSPPAGAVDADGSYHELRRDAWGVLWECRIFGIAGHPLQRPLDDWANLANFRPPQIPPSSGPEFESQRARIAEVRKRYFIKTGWVDLFEVLRAVRRFEDVLVDLVSDSPEIHRLADMVAEYQLRMIDYLLKRGADAIQLADDWGTQTSLLCSPKLWKRFFMPRYKRLIDRIHAAGKKVFFHSCGYIQDLLEGFAEIGVDVIWPQITLFDEKELARRCRELKLAVEVRPDPAQLMTFGRPQEVRDAVYRLAEAFRMDEGGAWLYVEIDNGMPFENVRSLIETIAEIRHLK